MVLNAKYTGEEDGVHHKWPFQSDGGDRGRRRRWRSQGNTKVTIVQPRNMSDCAKFHCNTSKSSRDINTVTGILCLMSVHNFKGMYPNDLSETKVLDNWPTNQRCYSQSHVTSMVGNTWLYEYMINHFNQNICSLALLHLHTFLHSLAQSAGGISMQYHGS